MTCYITRDTACLQLATFVDPGSDPQPAQNPSHVNISTDFQGLGTPPEKVNLLHSMSLFTDTLASQSERPYLRLLGDERDVLTGAQGWKRGDTALTGQQHAGPGLSQNDVQPIMDEASSAPWEAVHASENLLMRCQEF